MSDYRAAIESAFKNRQALEESEACGCYGCCRVISIHDIVEWVDDGETALCPYCKIDCLIPNTAGLSLDVADLERYREGAF